MSIKITVTEEMKTAMKARDKDRLGVIRLIMAAIKQREVDERIELNDEQVLTTLDKMLKQRRDSISQYEAADRQELADIEKAEIVVIESFLPQALTDDEIDTMIASAISNTGAESMRDMGKVMGIVKPQILGRADAGAVSAKIKEKLS